MIRRIYHYWLIWRSGLFDRAYYRRTHADALKRLTDPLWHFVSKGWHEGYHPSPDFDLQVYLELNPDVESADINPLVHFILHGQGEQRRAQAFSSEDIHFNYLNLAAANTFRETLLQNAANPPTTADVILFPFIDWYSRFQRPQHLTRQLAGMGHRVFYLKTGFCRQPTPLIKEIEANIWSVQLSQGEHNIQFNQLLPEAALEPLAASFRVLKDAWMINAAVMLVDLPFWVPLVRLLKNRYGWRIAYDCMDLHQGFTGHHPDAQKNENKLLQESDLVIASSRKLFEIAQKANPNSILIPNGVDFDHFHPASAPMKAAELSGLPTPIIGYYGAIADWFDTALVADLAQAHPDWTFVLIGSTHQADLTYIQNLPNIHLLGEKAYADLPSYLSHFDICLIPFKQRALTHATNPVKLFEYLAAGKPVVATRLDELTHYEEFVILVDTTDAWEAAVQSSLTNKPTPAVLEQRFNFAHENTWQARAVYLQKQVIKTFQKISIIVVTFNQLDHTRRCLESILKNTGYPNFEIIIVDNGSQGELVAFLEAFADGHPNTRLVLIKSNLGFARANNQGVQIAQGDYLVLLNNDTIVTPGWLHRLLRHLEKNPDVGMVGPVTNAISNQVKIHVNYTGLDYCQINAFAAQRAIDFDDKSFQIEMLALYCAMISRVLYLEVGGLDQRYGLGMFEDDDLAMTLHQRGLKCLCAEDVFIHHSHQASFKKMENEQYRDLFNSNRQRFEEKWGVQWQPHQHRVAPSHSRPQAKDHDRSQQGGK